MKTLTATCSICGRKEKYYLSEKEYHVLQKYRIYGRQLGMPQDLFPKIPAWIRSGAIDKYSNGFCICPKCCGK